MDLSGSLAAAAGAAPTAARSISADCPSGGARSTAGGIIPAGRPLYAGGSVSADGIPTAVRLPRPTTLRHGMGLFDNTRTGFSTIWSRVFHNSTAYASSWGNTGAAGGGRHCAKPRCKRALPHGTRPTSSGFPCHQRSMRAHRAHERVRTLRPHLVARACYTERVRFRN